MISNYLAIQLSSCFSARVIHRDSNPVWTQSQSELKMWITLAKVFSSRLSKSSVTLPPYCTSPSMYRTVFQDTPFLMSMSSRWFWTNCTLAVKSAWLNSYGIFHPNGPYFRRSWRKKGGGTFLKTVLYFEAKRNKLKLLWGRRILNSSKLLGNPFSVSTISYILNEVVLWFKKGSIMHP